MQIINKLVEINALNIEGRLFNLFDPLEGIRKRRKIRDTKDPEDIFWKFVP